MPLPPVVVADVQVGVELVGVDYLGVQKINFSDVLGVGLWLPAHKLEVAYRLAQMTARLDVVDILRQIGTGRCYPCASCSKNGCVHYLVLARQTGMLRLVGFENLHSLSSRAVPLLEIGEPGHTHSPRHFVLGKDFRFHRQNDRYLGCGLQLSVFLNVQWVLMDYSQPDGNHRRRIQHGSH